MINVRRIRVWQDGGAPPQTFEVLVEKLGGSKDGRTRSPMRIERNNVRGTDGSHCGSVVRKGREGWCLVRD
jgi:hypothetical protein